MYQHWVCLYIYIYVLSHNIGKTWYTMGIYVDIIHTWRDGNTIQQGLFLDQTLEFPGSTEHLLALLQPVPRLHEPLLLTSLGLSVLFLSVWLRSLVGACRLLHLLRFILDFRKIFIDPTSHFSVSRFGLFSQPPGLVLLSLLQ